MNFDEGAIFDLLHGEDGPVWGLVEELSDEAADIARRLVPVRGLKSTWSARSNAAARWATLESIRSVIGYDSEGDIYGGINAIELPSIFLEYPRVDRTKQPFLTTAVWSLEALL